jgi:hypothetical protein
MLGISAHCVGGQEDYACLSTHSLFSPLGKPRLQPLHKLRAFLYVHFETQRAQRNEQRIEPDLANRRIG